MLVHILAVVGTILVSKANIIDKQISHQFLRYKRNNEGFDEEVFKSIDLEKECFEEVCNIYEADEIIQHFLETPESSSLVHEKYIKH